MGKPPLGIMPRFIWDEKRLNDLTSAMDRYKNAGLDIPSEWIEEYNELSKRIDG